MPPKDKEAVELAASSSEKKKDDPKAKKNKENDGSIIKAEDSLSEEDKELKERLETCVDTVVNKDKEAAVTTALRLKALDVIVTELRTATSSMTSVPKPLKFLRPHFGDWTACTVQSPKKKKNSRTMGWWNCALAWRTSWPFWP